MERIISDQINNYLTTWDLLSPSQHGFSRGRSTGSNVLESVTDWLLTIDSGSNVDVVYVDIRKAFDSVVYSKLLHKIVNFGIEGDLLEWVSNYFLNR